MGKKKRIDLTARDRRRIRLQQLIIIALGLIIILTMVLSLIYNI